MGTVYLIHFESGLRIRENTEARHYLGWTADLDARLREHRAGAGSSLMRAISLAGIGWEVVRTWEGVDRAFERRLKRRHEAPRFCPLCVAHRNDKRGLLG